MDLCDGGKHNSQMSPLHDCCVYFPRRCYVQNFNRADILKHLFSPNDYSRFRCLRTFVQGVVSFGAFRTKAASIVAIVTETDR